MTHTIISLVSILAGVLGANIWVYQSKKSNLGLSANSILGVFGSVFFIKSFGRLGFDPNSIMASGTTNTTLLFINLSISVFGGVLFAFLGTKLKKINLNTKNSPNSNTFGFNTNQKE